MTGPTLYAVDVIGQVPARTTMIVADHTLVGAGLIARNLATTIQRKWTVGGTDVSIPEADIEAPGVRCVDTSERRKLTPEPDGAVQTYRVMCNLWLDAETAEEASEYIKKALAWTRMRLASGGAPASYTMTSENGFTARVELDLEEPSPHQAVQTVDDFLRQDRKASTGPRITEHRVLAVARVAEGSPTALADENAKLKHALSVATGMIMEGEPGDSRAVSDVAVALASVMTGDMSPEVMEVIDQEHERLQQPRDPERRRPDPEIEVAAEDTPTYEVLGYDHQEDFDVHTASLLATGLLIRSEAIDLAREQLATFPIVKVQSDDREFIEVLRREPEARAAPRRKPRP